MNEKNVKTTEGVEMNDIVTEVLDTVSDEGIISAYSGDYRNKIEYVVNEEKRTVTAILMGTKFLAAYPLERMNNGIDPVDGDIEALSVLMLPNKFVATVRCVPEDTFDEAEGKRLAKKKLLVKIDRQRSRAWYRYKELLQNRILAVERCIGKYYSDYTPKPKPRDFWK